MSQAATFIVPRSQLKYRLDVNFARKAASPITEPPKQDAAALVLLGDVLKEIRYGTSAKATAEPGGLPVLRMGNVQDGSLDIGSLKYVVLPEPEVRRLALQRGDILVNRTNTKELVGKAAIFDLPGTWLFASYLLRLRVNEQRLLPEYLNAWFGTPDARLQIDQHSRQAAGMTNINTSELRDLRLPLPSLPTQARLVKAIVAARARRDRLLHESLAARMQVDRTLLERLGLPPISDDDETLEHGYGVRRQLLEHNRRLDVSFFHPARVAAISAVGEGNSARLGDVVQLRRGSAAADHKANILGLADVESHTGRLSGRTLGPRGNGDDTGAALRFEAGDILYGRLRPNLNKVWLADRNGYCSPEFRVFRPGSSVEPRYLVFVLRSSYTLAQTSHATTGNTHPRIRNEDLLDVLIPLPGMPEQRRLVEEVSDYADQAVSLARQAAEVWGDAKAQFEIAVDRLDAGS